MELNGCKGKQQNNSNWMPLKYNDQMWQTQKDRRQLLSFFAELEEDVSSKQHLSDNFYFCKNNFLPSFYFVISPGVGKEYTEKYICNFF